MLDVLMTADAVGGVWSYARTLSSELARRGVRVTIATMGPPPARAEVEGAAVRVSTFALEWTDDPWDDVARAGEWLLALEREVRPDVVHVNGYAHGSLPWRAPAICVAHSCVVSWWLAVFGEEAPARYDRYRAEVRRGLASAACVVAPTCAMLDAIRAHHIEPRRARVIANGCHAPVAAVAKEPLVFAAGRVWDRAKNVRALGEVAAQLPWPVFVAGDNDGEPLSSVTHLGRLDAPAIDQWMARASIFAHPALYEPFGPAALEAGLRGCALVLGDIESLREVWADSALFVKDEGDLAAALERLIGDRALREEMAERARARAGVYRADRMTDQYLDLYRELLGERTTSCA